MGRGFFGIIALALGLLPGAPICSSWAKPQEQLAPDRLAMEIGARIERVPEFQFIRQQAEKLGVRVYLFGGTAAAYSHYVREDLLREAGDARFPPFRFDYDYTNIFRSTQDLDLVVDGTAEQAEALEDLLKRRYPHFVGSKSNWEIRPLRVARGEKEAILGNPDFANQHTDSHSTGLVEVSKPADGSSAVRDARDWEGKGKPQFLKDVTEGRLHFYFNPSHEATARARQGLNPPILSAIRYLTKAFQYGLEINGEDRAKIQEIIAAFQPEDINNDYLKRWIEKNGKKLIQHSLDIERSWDELERLGLRQKLIRVRGNPKEEQSLAWWLSREPLRSRPVGQGTGKTAAQIAKELGQEKLLVAHEANSFLAWESISRDRAGKLNALISREAAVGEAAAYGNGFYTQIGRQGARGTGFTVRMELEPKAREGTDFTRVDNYIILHNKEAVRVLPEQMQMSLSGYLQRIAQGERFSSDDTALLEKLKRSISIQGADEEEMRKALQLVRENFSSPRPSLPLIKEWFSLPVSVNHPELVEPLLKTEAFHVVLAADVLSQPHWSSQPKFVESLIRGGTVDKYIIEHVLSQPQWAAHPELLEALLKKGTHLSEIAEFVLSKPHWKDHPEFLEALIRSGTVDNEIAEFVLSRPHWQGHPAFLERLIQGRRADYTILTSVLSQPHWQGHPEFLRAILDRGKLDKPIAGFVLSQPHWKDYPEFVEVLLERGRADEEIAKYVLSHRHWRDHPEFVEALLRKGRVDSDIALHVLTQPHWKDHPEWVEALIQRGRVSQQQMDHLLNLPHWADHPRLRELAGGQAPTFSSLRAALQRVSPPSVPAPSSMAGCSSWFRGLMRSVLPH